MCVKNAYVWGDVRRRKCREASKVTVLVAAGSAEQCCIVVLLFALARNVLRVFGSLYKATSVICGHQHTHTNTHTHTHTHTFQGLENKFYETRREECMCQADSRHYQRERGWEGGREGGREGGCEGGCVEGV